MFVNEVSFLLSTNQSCSSKFERTINQYALLSQPQTATIDEDSAAQMRTLLLLVTLVSNFPLLIVGMGIILLLVLVVLFCRNRQKKVGSSAVVVH